MKKILLMIVGLLLLVGANAQISQLGGIERVQYSRGDRPLEGKEYDYRILMTGGKSAVWVRLICKNGVFTIDNSTIYNTNVLNSFSLKVKWGSAGPGEIYAEDSNGYKAVYRVDVEKPGISISGPSSTKYNDYAEYSISVNPNISIKSATWNNSQEFKYISGQGTSNYKVQVVKNDKKVVNNAIEVTAQTDYGVFYANKNVSIEPVFAITTNQTTVYSGDYVSYSINAISGAVITWESVNNTTLISGQGTSTAIFKTFDKGYGIVRAIITYAGISYTVENSSVRIDSGSISYNAIKNYTDISRLDRVGSLTFGSEIRGATKFQWYGGFPVEYKGSKTSPIVTVDKKHIISKGFGMTIWVTASNDKESVTIYYFVSVDGVGGLDPTVE
ncbi:MAG: hypothetical protein KH100_04930 [Dysgonomonas mossii]|uniref:hypothetical protein n=1 Tax=Dysgonomonas mossii TaxID=163665 RepID=UPI001D3898D8|nr:hypothetical protein [Dysgonomonas mossii]MBS5795651.1 hypothetical protein [Dysgonomonas mossii]MBS7110530.1 hypothetical protein [Dysgonomonas mossii]